MNEPDQTLPANVRPYKRSAVFDETTMPAGLRRRHCTKPGIWGVIRVIEGQLRYRVLDSNAESVLDSGHPGVALPEQFHEVEPLGLVRFFVEFHSVAEAKASGGTDSPVLMDDIAIARAIQPRHAARTMITRWMISKLRD